jgi:hypothetical protein
MSISPCIQIVFHRAHALSAMAISTSALQIVCNDDFQCIFLRRIAKGFVCLHDVIQFKVMCTVLKYFSDDTAQLVCQ